MRDERQKLAELIFAALGQELSLPPLPVRLGRFFDREGGASSLYGSNVALEHEYPYLDQRQAELFLTEAPVGYMAVGFWGYGVNSYAFYYCCSEADLKVFLRIPYGGAYMGEAERDRLVAFFERFTPFLKAVRPLVQSLQLLESMGSSYRRIVTKTGEMIEEHGPSLDLEPEYVDQLLGRLRRDATASTGQREAWAVAGKRRDFYGQMRDRQVQWRAQALPDISEWGDWNGEKYEHILPRSSWTMNLWPGIRTAIPRYLEENHVKAHEGKHNLLSSWVLGASLYFPFGQSEEGRDLLASFLREKVDPRIQSVKEVALEFEDLEPLTTASLLGEKDGARGVNQTSPDVGVRVVLQGGEEGLVLIEVKFCEKNFSSCSARRRELAPRGRQAECEDLAHVLSDLGSGCAQHSFYHRRYFDHLAQPLVAASFAGSSRCPAAINGYQLFRQQALAEALAASERYGLVASSLAYHGGNTVLAGCLGGMGLGALQEWGTVFAGKAPFKAFTHQDWVMHVATSSGAGDWMSWLEWVDARYALQQ